MSKLKAHWQEAWKDREIFQRFLTTFLLIDLYGTSCTYLNQNISDEIEIVLLHLTVVKYSLCVFKFAYWASLLTLVSKMCQEFCNISFKLYHRFMIHWFLLILQTVLNCKIFSIAAERCKWGLRAHFFIWNIIFIQISR